MNKKIILLMAIIMMVMSQTGQLTFNLGSTRYTKASDYWTVDVPCTGGSGQYQYACQLPTGWRLENNLFKIPSSCSTNYNFEYVARCRVKDVSIGRILERALIFKSTPNGYVITDKDYFYGLLSYTSSLSSITGLDVLNRLNTLTGSLTNTLGSFSANFGSLATFTGVSSGYFAGLPAWADCDRFISDGNIAEILALIQKVVSSTNIKCDAKVAWLNDLLGRINAAIQIKRESIAQLQALINGIATQIEKLLLQITNLKTEQSNLNLEGLKAQIDELMIKLQAAYTEYNNCIGSTKEFEVQLAQLQQEQKNLEIRIQQLRYTIENLISRRKQLDREIAALEKKLSDLKAQRTQVVSQISSLTSESDLKKTRLIQVKNRITYLLTKIQTINQNCASIKSRYLQLQTDLKALQAKYNQAVTRSDSISQQISSIEIQINKLKSQSNDYSIKLKAIQQCIDNLLSAIKQIEQSIRYVQYQCYECRDVVVVDQDVEPYFRFDRNNWFNYMNKCYGANVPQIQPSFPTVNVDVKVVTVFSPAFLTNYGSCFGEQIKTIGSQWNNGFSFAFDGDFSCSSGFDRLVRNNGKIRAINKQWVDVDCQDGQQIRLRLGSCSRFEGQGKDFIPKVGHNIHFKGVRNTDNTYNLHSCSCY